MSIYKHKSIFKLGFSLLIGVASLMGTYGLANQTDETPTETSEQRLTRMAAEKAGKVARVEALVQTWLHSGEYKEILFKAFYTLSDSQLAAVEAADNYESVRAIAFGQGLTLAAKGTQAKLGDAAMDLVYSPVSPCRIYSSRDLPSGADPFTDDTTRSVYVHGSPSGIGNQGGDTAGCATPRTGDPHAVHININVIPVVTDPPVNNGKGTVKVAPKGEAATTQTVLVKFNAGTNSSNAATIKTCVGCAQEIDVRTTGNNVHVILEVLGYYYPVDEDDADRLPVAFGYVNSDGTKASGTENVSSTWSAGLKTYLITLSDLSPSNGSVTTVVTPNCNADRFLAGVIGTQVAVQFVDDSTGLQQCAFQFVTYRNQ